MNRWPLFAVLLGSVGLFSSALYTVDAREVAVVTQFGAPVRTVTEPGLYLRAPWPLHQVIRFDRRARVLEIKATELLTRDKKNLVVEPFALWRVADPARFLEVVGTDAVAETQLGDLVISRIAAALGQLDFSTLVLVEAAPTPMLPPEVLTGVQTISRERLGVEILDIRLRHVGLPLQNEQSIYDRMRAERLRIANAYRSEGEEKAAAIRAEADRKAAEIRAAAERDAARVYAEAEATASRLYAEAYRQDPELYAWLRQLEGYEAIFDEDATIILQQPAGLTP